MDGRSLLAASEVLLLDFDGPVCSVFAGYPASRVADELRDVVLATGGVVPPELATTTDPHRLIRVSATAWRELVPVMDDALGDAEVLAVASAVPTVGPADVLLACHRARRPVVVVSNNSARAVQAYLDSSRLAALVVGVMGRPRHRPDLMKPHPHVVRQALTLVGVAPERAVLVGDAATDMVVAGVCGVPSIGLADKPHKVEALVRAGATVVVRSMTELVDARAG